MATIQFNGNKLHYLILDCGDGSARVQFFVDKEALDLYLEKIEESSTDWDLSEGGSYVDQSVVDRAMTVDDVQKEFP